MIYILAPAVRSEADIDLLGREARLESEPNYAVINKEIKTMGSTSDKISGKANELIGKAKQAVGDATDNRTLEAKGVAQEAKGDAQQAKGHAKDALKNVVDKA
ncbi:uncharacterized protein YjbJ (UPF0337 family) [Neorhizobium sp. JUb45]|nr:uncharacterized protein YjbJ (UPF0337 family) [Neorhizobium sp. JUb45]